MFYHQISIIAGTWKLKARFSESDRHAHRELSLKDCLLEIGYYCDAVIQASQVECDYEQALAELSAVEL